MTAAYVKNRCYNPSRIPAVEAFTGQKPNISNMNKFGCECYANIQDKAKLDARSKKAVFNGYDKGSPAYLIYSPDKDTIRRVLCITFGKELFEPTHKEEGWEIERPVSVVETAQLDISEEEKQREEQESRYPRRGHRMPKHLSDYVLESDNIDCTFDYCYALSLDDVPQSYDDAISSSEAGKWKVAMREEICALNDNKTFALVELPEDKKVIRGRWVYTKKIGPDNDYKYKARYVAEGYSQVPNIDYKETFSPTARITSIRIRVCKLIYFYFDFDLIIDILF